MDTFLKVYDGYEFPFDRLRDKLDKKNEAELREYYKRCDELLQDEVLQDILQEGVRKMYQKLAVATQNSDEQNAYRATLIWIKTEFEGTLKELASLYSQFNANPIKERF